MRWFPLSIVLAAGFMTTAAAAEPFGVSDPMGWPGRARIGVQVQPMTPELREFLQAPRDLGVLVVRVLEASPAGKAGVRVGDIITEVSGEPVEKPFHLIRIVATADRDECLELSLQRKGEALSVSVRPEGLALPWPGNKRWDDFGHHWWRGLREGAESLRERLEDLERRLRELELERRVDDALQPGRPT